MLCFLTLVMDSWEMLKTFFKHSFVYVVDFITETIPFKLYCSELVTLTVQAAPASKAAPYMVHLPVCEFKWVEAVGRSGG